MIRDKLYLIIEPTPDRKLNGYDIVMIIAIITSIIPLMFKSSTYAFSVIENIVTLIFIIDYLLRWITADKKQMKPGIIPFIVYPFTFMAIIDLLSILPGIVVVNQSFRLLRMVRLLRIARTIRVIKSMRYSRNIRMIIRVLNDQKDSLIAVCCFAGSYIFISSLLLFNIEPDTFDTFFDAIYCAAISLTTVGYGDIYPVSQAGRIFTIISSFFGIAIIALPAGIITAGFLDELNSSKKVKEEEAIK